MIIITTDRLIIRHFTLNDTEQTYLFSQEESLGKGIPNQVYDDIDEAKETLEYLISLYDTNQYPYVMAIDLKSNNEYIGHIGLSKISQGIEIGYFISEKHQGNGYATEAVKVFCEWSKVEFNLDTICGITLPDNIASKKVLIKCGFALIEENKYILNL